MRFRNGLSVLLLTALAAACGGGGGSDAPPPASEPQTAASPSAGSSQPTSAWQAAVPVAGLDSNTSGSYYTSLVLEGRGDAFYFLTGANNNRMTSPRVLRRPGGQDWDGGTTLAAPVDSIGFGGDALIRRFEKGQIALDGAGNALAIFGYRDDFANLDRDFTAQVFVRRRDAASGAWSAAHVLESTPGAFAKDGRLVVEADGTAWAVWTERTFKDTWFAPNDLYAVFAAKFTPGGGWSAPEKVSGDMRWDIKARVATDRRGNPRLLIAWNGTFPLEATLLYGVRSAQGKWTVDTVWVAQPAGGTAPRFFDGDYDLAVDADDHAIVMWRQYDGQRYVALVRHFTPKGGWETAILLSLPELDSAIDPQLAMDADGNAFLLYQQSDGIASYMIVAVRYEKGSGWVLAKRISTFTGMFGDADLPRIAFDAAGNAVAIWRKYDPALNRTVIRANTYSRAAGWGKDETISGPAGRGETVWIPDLAVSASGHAIATWWQVDGPSQMVRPWSASRPASALQ